MKLPDYRNEYGALSSKASDVCRQLAFAGFAVIWIFAIGKDIDRKIPPDLIWPCVFLIGSLAADFLHYVSGSIVWGSYYRYLERKGYSDEEEIPRHSVVLTWPQLAFYWSKIILVGIAYGLILKALIHRLLA